MIVCIRCTISILETGYQWEKIGNLAINDCSFGFVIRSLATEDIKKLSTITILTTLELS